MYVLTILESILKIEKYTKAFSTADELYFANDQLQFNAVLKLLSVIGEDVGKLDKIYLEEHPSIPWKLIKDTRNFLVHDYRKVDHFIVFSIVKDELPELKSVSTNILTGMRLEISNDAWQTILNSPFYTHSANHLKENN